MSRAGPFADETEPDAPPDMATELRRVRKSLHTVVFWLRVGCVIGIAGVIGLILNVVY